MKKKKCRNCHYRNKETGSCFCYRDEDVVDKNDSCDLHVTEKEWQKEMIK